MLKSNLITMKRMTALLLTTALIAVTGCQKKTERLAMQQQNALTIDEYIRGLQYNPGEMLNAQSVASGTSQVTQTGTETLGTSISGGYSVTCVKKHFTMKENFDDVAILRPTNGIIYPGALIYGDASMLDGAPTPLQVQRAPAKFHIDLPGIGNAGNIQVDHPDNGTVQAAIDNALDYWNNHAYQDGYVNPAYVSYKASTSYSSQQLALSVGLNVEWMGNEVASQFNYSSTTVKKVAMMVFKQGFYTVTMNIPLAPSEVFGNNVSLDKVKSVINHATPPAYVQSVVYGRIIMFRMESNLQVTDADMNLALEYATGVTNVSGNTETKIRNILANSTTTVALIGGNAAVATEAVSAQNFGDLQQIIKGQNAVYNKNNPGVPIAYTVLYLKDNSHAKMGYSTDYDIDECTKALIPGAPLSLFCEAGYVNRFQVRYKNADNVNKTYNSGNVSLGQTKKYTLPDGAHDIYLDIDFHTGVGWHDQKTYHYNLPEKHCYKTWGTVFSPQIGAISCN